MAKFTSPLATKLTPGAFGAVGKSPICLTENPIGTLWQIAGWADFEDASEPVMSSLGLGRVTNYRDTQSVENVTCWRIAPDRALIRGCGDLSKYANSNLMVLDLSHTRTAISITGSHSRDLLSKLCAVDVSSGAFQPQQFIQTGMHHIGVIVLCHAEDVFEILVPVTWAETLWEVICANSAPFGYEIEVGDVADQVASSCV